MIQITPFVIAGEWERDIPTPKSHKRIVMPPIGHVCGAGWEGYTQAGLRAIAQYVKAGHRVLDVGTGSGIQAVAACLRGASHVTAVEINPDALAVAPIVLGANGCADRVSLVTDIPNETFDVAIISVGSAVSDDLAATVTARTILIVHNDNSVEARSA